MSLDLKSGMMRGLSKEKNRIKERFPQDKFDLAEETLSKSLLLSEEDSSITKKESIKKAVKEDYEIEVKKSVYIPTGRVKRDTFSMPIEDHEKIRELRTRCLKMGQDTTRSELVRAGILLLSKLNNSDLKEALEEVIKLKPGVKKK